MKAFIFVVAGLTLALASPNGFKEGNPQQEYEFRIPEKQYPEVITNFPESIDYSQLSTEELIALASEHEGLEFLADANLTAAMGIDINAHHDLVADALSTTVRHISILLL